MPIALWTAPRRGPGPSFCPKNTNARTCRDKNPDLEYLDEQGNVVGYGEVKTVGDADQGAFNKQLATAVKQLRVREDVEGEMDVNKSSFRSPTWSMLGRSKGGSAPIRKAACNHGSDLDKIRGYHVRVYTESGSKLADFDLGIDADEGHVEGHTYYSPNGNSY
ncbi:hypothetical protein [Streptomyces sp. NBC_00986]|uniref:hypothetical protein n=1 Tax=Streptomyces sp. NBC_00986 TaxID=2903702 RepID=UPI003865BE1F|nr:hypothetical protein OG504_01880 [Streptomyces sp. NBC_00986]